MLSFVSIDQTECNYEKGCHLDKSSLSCRYLDHLNDSIEKEYYASPELAIQAVKDGNAWGAIYFTENFTDALVARMALGKTDLYINIYINIYSGAEFPKMCVNNILQVVRRTTKPLTSPRSESGSICPTSRSEFYLIVTCSSPIGTLPKDCWPLAKIIQSWAISRFSLRIRFTERARHRLPILLRPV